MQAEEAGRSGRGHGDHILIPNDGRRQAGILPIAAVGQISPVSWAVGAPVYRQPPAVTYGRIRSLASS